MYVFLRVRFVRRFHVRVLRVARPDEAEARGLLGGHHLGGRQLGRVSISSIRAWCGLGSDSLAFNQALGKHAGVRGALLRHGCNGLVTCCLWVHTGGVEMDGLGAKIATGFTG